MIWLTRRQASKAPATRNSATGRRQRGHGFLFAISRDRTVQPFARIAMHDQPARRDVNNPVFEIPARAYSSAFVVRSKPKVESEISTTRRRSAGRGLASRNSRDGLASTIKSGSGSFVGLSSGATSIGASGFTNCSRRFAPTRLVRRQGHSRGDASAQLADQHSTNEFVWLTARNHCAGFSGILNTAASSGTFASIFSTVISIARRPFTSCVRLNGISTPSTGL